MVAPTLNPKHAEFVPTSASDTVEEIGHKGAGNKNGYSGDRVSCDEVGGDSGQKGPGDGVEHLDGCNRGKHDQVHFDRPALDISHPEFGGGAGFFRFSLGSSVD